MRIIARSSDDYRLLNLLPLSIQGLFQSLLGNENW
jgi:hypothetical protein